MDLSGSCKKTLVWGTEMETYQCLCWSVSVVCTLRVTKWFGTICWMRWKLFPWKLKACSKRTLSSTVHSSGNGVKFGRSARDFSILCLCQNSIPRA